MTRGARGPARWLAWLFLADFVSFALASMYLRGDALGGRVVGSHFYLVEHGRFVEVSETVFAASRLHGLSVGVVFVLMLAVAAMTPGGLRFRVGEAERARSAVFVVSAIALVVASRVVMDLLDLHYHFRPAS